MRERRRSYTELKNRPAWGVRRDGKIVASVRAIDEQTAKELFIIHHMLQKGDAVVRLEYRDDEG